MPRMQLRPDFPIAMSYNISPGETSTEMIYINQKWPDFFFAEVMEVFWGVFLTYEAEILVCIALYLFVTALFVFCMQNDMMGVPDTQCRTEHRFTHPEDVTGRSEPMISSYTTYPVPKNKRSRRHRRKRRNSAVSDILLHNDYTPSRNGHKNTKKIQGIQNITNEIQGICNTTNELQYNSNERHIHWQEFIDLEAEKEQPYLHAVQQSCPGISWDNIETAIIYLHKFSALVRNAKIVMKALDHIKDLMENPQRKMELHEGHNIPVDYTVTELWDIVTNHHRDMKDDEFHWVHQEFRRENGFPPTPGEFCVLYEKSIETAKIRKKYIKLQKKYDESQKCCENLREELEKKQQVIRDQRLELSQLEILKTRSLCKICLQNEISVLYQPCAHAVSCRSCCISVAARQRRKQICPICTTQVKTTKYLFLA